MLILDLIKRYKDKFLNVALIGPYIEGKQANELYKWRLITDCKDKSSSEIIDSVKRNDYNNLIYAKGVIPVWSDLLKTQSNDFVAILEKLRNESKPLSNRLFAFKNEMINICENKFKYKADDERTAATFLTCVNPFKYTFYKFELYQNYCEFIGEETKNPCENYPHYLKLLGLLSNAVEQDVALQNKFKTETNGLIQSDLLIAQNILWQMRNDMFSTVETKDNKQMQEMNDYTELLKKKKNIILQGAPGVGKTYTTAALALSICGENIPDKHNDVMKQYEKLQKEGRIGFVTFHQSMDYEDFVEGIKPKIIDEDKMIYKVENGIFKQICLNAGKIETDKKSSEVDFTKTRVFKMSLGEKGKDDSEIFDYCFENNVIALGWGDDNDFSECAKIEDFKKIDPSWGAKAMMIFKQWMQIGDIVLISDGLKAITAIAKIVSEYEYRKDTPINMCQFRKVEWLYKGNLIPISKLYDKNLSQQSIYGFFDSKKQGTKEYNGSIKVDVLNEIITGKINDETVPNYVLIIDEINRGNVSKIFGELITLLEADKRIDGDHPIKVTLPYSKEEFGVPSNLYIIGTMNTTDRSVGNIDYAVRRRFAFVTLKSKRKIVEENSIQKALKLFDAVETFIKTNQIEMDFEDLMVGHSYFIAKDEAELKMKLDYEIIPLLREYYKDGLLKQDVTPEIAVGTWRAASLLQNQSDVTQSDATEPATPQSDATAPDASTQTT